MKYHDWTFDMRINVMPWTKKEEEAYNQLVLVKLVDLIKLYVLDKNNIFKIVDIVVGPKTIIFIFIF